MTARVSVICTTYNHAAYVRQAIDSLLNQNTDFDYKIIIHDDCSTDGTTEIVEEYARLNSDRIALITQEENIYSKDISYIDYIEPLLEGDYIAICEGDDYWTSEDKLQMQFDFMEKHPDYSLCVHASALYHDGIGSIVGCTKPSSEECDFTIEDAILGGGSLYATNAVFYKREFLRMPSALCNWGVGDYPRSIYLAMMGKVHYFPQVLSAYRMFAKGSWSSGMKRDRSREVRSVEKRIDGLKRFDAFTGYVYHETVAGAIASREQYMYTLMGDWAAAKKVKGVPSSEASAKNELVKWLDCHTPVLASAVRNLRWHINAMRLRKK